MPASDTTWWMAAANMVRRLGVEQTPAPASVSGTAAAANATMGTPWCIASSSGTQNPSCSDADTNTSADR